MSSIILQNYNINNNDIYVNGRILNPNNLATTIVTTSKDNENYNLDLLVETGLDITLTKTDIVLENDTSNRVVFTKIDNHTFLVQLVRLPSARTDLVLKIKDYTVNIVIEEVQDKSVLVPNIRTSESVSLTPNGATEYPLSNLDMPIPIADQIYKLSWLVNNRRYTLGSDNSIDVKIFTHKRYLDIKLEGDSNNRLNDIDLEFKQDIDKVDIIETNYIPLVCEFTRGNKVISCRSVLFVHIPTLLVNDWYKPYTHIEVDKMSSHMSFNKTFRQPNLDMLVTPYVENVNSIWSEASNIARKRYRLIPDTKNEIQSTLTLKDDNHLELEIVNESNISTNSYLDFSFYIGTVLVRNKHQRVFFKQINNIPTLNLQYIDLENNRVDINNGTIITNKKYNKTRIHFKATNGAELKIITDLPDATFHNDIVYKDNLPFNNKDVYPELKGYIELDTTNIDPSDHELSFILIDINNQHLITYTFTLKMLRPDADIITDLSTDMLHVRLEDGNQLITVNNQNVFKVTATSGNDTLYTATVQDIDHSQDLLETGTYGTYNFKINIQPLSPGVTNLTILLSDDQDNITKTIIKPIDVWTTDYTPIQPDPSETDNTYGCKIDVVYNKPTNDPSYTLPLAFVNNGEECDYILVAKYPLSQNSYKEDPNTRTRFINISKLGQPRLEYVESNRVDENRSKVLTTNFKEVTNGIIENELLINTQPVINSAYIDTMLANLADAHAYKCYINNNYSRDINDYVRIKVKSNKKYQPYLNTDMNTNKIDNNIIYIGHKDQANPTITMFGLKNNDLDNLIPNYGDKTKMYRFPYIGVYNGITTHNGQLNGIVEPFGFGVKTYSDILVKKKGKNTEIFSIDPYQTDRVITDDTDKFTKLNLDTGKYMVNTGDTINYIGVNDYSLVNNKVYNNVSYQDEPSDSMLSNLGIPIDTDVNLYTGNTQKHNTGYNKHKPLPKFCNSIYSYNTTKIKSTGYIVSGTTLNNKLVLVNTEDNDKSNINKKYGYLNNVELTYDIGSFRSRVLIDSETTMHTADTSDQMIIDQRVAFILPKVVEPIKDEEDEG